MQTLGPPNAKIMIVGDFPSQFETATGTPFMGPAGTELTKMLHEAGIAFSSCFTTMACPYTPPCKDPYEWIDFRRKPRDASFVPWKNGFAHGKIREGEERLLKQLLLVRPTIVICMGNLPLKIFTDRWGAGKWRGSVLQCQVGDLKFKVVPVLPMRTILADWSARATQVQDFRRVLRESASGEVIVPEKRYIIRPSFEAAVTYLHGLLDEMRKGPLRIACDIETRAGHIACIGFATSRRDAICIPLMCIERPEGYWSFEEELILWNLMRQVLTHVNLRIVGQNFLYDTQYFYRFLLVDIKIWWDTMVAQHCIFPGTPKALDYLASLYCEHYVYWKDDGKEWNAKTGEAQLWVYNCDDCCNTFEIMDVQVPIIEADPRLKSIWSFQQNVVVKRCVEAMHIGVRTDHTQKKSLSRELMTEMQARQAWIEDATGHALNIKSSPQMQRFFYEDLKFKVVVNRKTRKPTCDDDALEVFRTKEPAVRPLIRRIQELRSLGVFHSTFVEAKADIDGRMRSSYNPTGAETFRLSSSTNAFWSGINFQNIPKGDEETDDPAVLQLPNIRRLYVPDPGMVMFDMDLDRADLQVVVWEADDEELRDALRQGVDLHSLNAKTLFGLSAPLGEIKTKHFDKRQLAKAWVHGTNYGGGPRTMAITCGITIREAEALQKRWFQAHPGIKSWHQRTEATLMRHRHVENKFGYRYTFFDRVEGALPQALAWTPQSTVARVINQAWDQILTRVPGVQILIQVHDSLVGQFPIGQEEVIIPQILEAAKVTIPYDKPLVIPAGIATSTVSWGHCK